MTLAAFKLNFDEWSHAVEFMDEVFDVGSRDPINLVGIEAAMEAAASGDFSKLARDRLRQMRTTIASSLNPSTLRRVHQGHLLNLGASAGSTARTNDFQLVRDIQDFMENSVPPLTIPSRNLTLPQPVAAGGNVGDGTITRFITDRHNHQIESTWAEGKSLTVIADQGNGVKGQETFAFEGDPFKIDGLELGGSGANGADGNFILKGIDARRAAGHLRNASFDEHDAIADDTAPTAIPGWVVPSTSANPISTLRMRTNATYIFRTTQGVAQGWGMEFTADLTIKQTFGATGAANPRLTETQPYYLAVPVRRHAAATGNITIKLGSQSFVQDISLLPAGFSLLILGPGDENWYSNWAEDGQGVEIEVDTLAVGTVSVDDAIFFPATFLDGTFFAAHGGAIPWSVAGISDSFTWTDLLIGAEAVYQYWLWRAGFESLPHTPPATQVVAAGGRTLTFATPANTITASTGDFVADGYKPGMTLTVVSPLNTVNSPFTILTVSALVITLIATDTVTAEGPLSTGETLDATATFPDP